MAADREQFLETMARKYLWWRSVDGRAFDEGRIIAQVLDIGTFEDATDLLKTVGEERVRDVLVTSEPGWFRRGLGRTGIIASGSFPSGNACHRFLADV